MRGRGAVGPYGEWEPGREGCHRAAEDLRSGAAWALR